MPFGVYLLEDNRWVIKAKMISLDKIEDEYVDLGPSGTRTVVKRVRVTFGVLIIKKL